jgi:hypothetical protein
MVLRLQQVAKIALSTGVIAAVSLIGTVYYVSEQEGDNYLEILSAFAMTQRHLESALWLSGFALVALIGILTWIIALYSTYRVAGPLHRFNVNLKRQILEGPLPVDQFKEGDFLQEEHLHFSAAAHCLQYHYDSINELTDLALAEENLPDPDLGGGLTTTLKKMRELDNLVKL